MAFYKELDPRIQVIEKTDDLPTINNDIVLQDIDNMVLPVAANIDYVMLAILELEQADAAADFRIGWTGPAGATMEWNDITTVVSSHTMGQVDTVGMGVETGVYVCKGILHVGATAGSLQMQASQNVATVADNSINKGSKLILIKAGR